MAATALAFCSALFWGVADFVGGLKSRTLPLPTVTGVAQLVGAAGAALALLVLAEGLPAGRALGYGALAGVANTAGLLAFYRGLAVGRMSVVAPIAGLGVLVPVSVGLASGERPGATRLCGVLIALIGVTLATRQYGPEGPETNWRAVGLAVVAALGIGGNLALIELAVHRAAASSVLWAVLLSRLAALAAVVGLTLIRRSRWQRPPVRALPSLLLLGTTDLLANVFYGLAVRTSLLTLGAVLASLHPAVTVVLANGVLSEQLGRAQRIGVVLAIAGACLLSVG